MVNVKSKRKTVELTEYEIQRSTNILRNEKIMEDLNIPSLALEVQQQKRNKKTTDEASFGHNLRSSSRVSAPQVDPQITASVGNGNLQDVATGDIHVQQKKNVRGPTKKANIFARQNKPKLQLKINENCQPCGPSSTEFPNFIGAFVRTKGFPIAHDDWRKTAAGKWKEFKAELRRTFKEDMEDEEFLALCDNRVHEEDWKWLINHWRTLEAAARSLRGKANRARLTDLHTTGSKSHARVDNEMTQELGRHPCRDELFIKTHTHKNGLPHIGSASTINALKDAVRDNPELKEKTIQEGDVYYHICGPEKNGYVRCIGFGPTPADLELPGAKRHTSTRLQMEIEARRQSDRKVEELSCQIGLLREEMNKWIQQQMSSQNASSTPYVSNNAPQVNSRNAPASDDVEADYNEDDAQSYASDDVVEELALNRQVLPLIEQHEEGGRDVILLSVVRPYGTPMAKATMQTKNPRAIVGGTRLGVQLCEVVVNHVFVRDAMLPRPYGALKSIGDACGRSIAWPHDRIKDDNKSSSGRQSKT